MNFRDLRARLTAEGIQLWVRDGQLRYRCVKGSIKPDMIDALRMFKAELVRHLESLSEGVDRTWISVPRPDTLPLTYEQEGLWFLNALGMSGSAYNIPIFVMLRGPLDLKVLARSVHALVTRHENLRTCFREVEGTPTQVIEPVHDIAAQESADALQLLDLSALPIDAAEEKLAAVKRAHARHRFDLGASPPLTVQLVRLSASEHVLVLNMHHILIDARSVGILFDELDLLYRAGLQGETPDLPPLLMQYADYAVWQRSSERDQSLDEQLQYWTVRLEQAPHSIALPCDRQRPLTPSFRGGTVVFEIPAPITRALNDLCAQRGMSPYMVILAAFQAFLFRWSGQSDILIGSPIAERGHPDAEHLIGYFLNKLVLRAQVAGACSFDELLTQVRTTVLEAYEHRDLPFERLVAAIQPDRALARHPVIQVMLGYSSSTPWRLGDLVVEPLQQSEETAKFDLTLAIVESEGRLTCTLEYASDLFERATIERAAGHFVTLFDKLLRTPTTPLRDLTLLSPAEHREILERWHNARTHGEGASCVHHLFERQAAENPDAVALLTEERSVTYGELNMAANRLAHHLRALGIGPEKLVGLCLNRSERLVVAVLAIWKAGGAYVPLDPSYPSSRLTLMQEDSDFAVVLVEPATRRHMPEAEIPVVCIVEHGAEISQRPSTNLPRLATPVNLSHCIYTSGSTGRPKAVALHHGGTVAMLCWAHRIFSASSEALERPLCVLGAASISFDLAVFELFYPLAFGGTVLLVEDILSVVDLPDGMAPDMVCIVPSSARAVFEAGALPSCTKLVLLAGEAVPSALLKTISAALPEARIYNQYGPTEDSCFSTSALLEPGDLVTIGGPIDGTRVYVLDERQQPVPVGVPGELYIAGAGLSRGYLQRPEQTATRFLPDPHGAPGSRMYRTGDRVRLRSDGNIEFLGRIDHQLKLRGFRIEPGEIEAALCQHPNIDDAAVVMSTDGAVGPHLVAYHVSAHGLDSADLREHLSESLPEYMIPAVFVPLERLPLLPNGKLDRAALPSSSAEREPRTGQGVEDCVEPSTAAEVAIADIFAEVLELDSVGAHDNFFHLGGDSLLVFRVVTRIRASLGAEIQFRDVFTSPTVAELAASLTPDEGDMPIPVSDRTGPLPVSFAQQRLWFLEQMEGTGTQYNLPIAWRLRGEVDVDALRDALEFIVHRHSVLRTKFISDGGVPMQLIGKPSPFVLPVTTLAPGQALEPLVHGEGLEPFDLEKGPLLRGRLISSSARDHVLVLTAHHIAFDGWSFDVLVRELAASYTALASGRACDLPALAIQYKDYALWQRERHREKSDENRDSAYWMGTLKGAPPALELPLDRPRPAVESHRGAWLDFELSGRLAQNLELLTKRTGTTLFMVLASAFSVLLHRYSRQDDVCLAYPVANRSRLELEDLIGFFANTLILRTRILPGDSVEILLARVRSMVLDAETHQDIPFERLVEMLNPPRDLSRPPLAQVAIGFQQLDRAALKIPSLKIAPFPATNRAAKFDLTLFIAQSKGRLTGAFEYAADLFDLSTIRRMVGHLLTLLEAMAARPEAPVRDLRLLSGDERRRRLDESRGVSIEIPRESLVHTAFAQQAGRTRDACAVQSRGRRLTYGELETRANQLAHHLRSLGVGPEVLVGVFLDRSVDLVVTLLGILKAGGAYLPLDPHYPRARMAFMLRDASVEIIVVHAGLIDRLPNTDAQLVCLDEGWPTIAQRASTPPSVAVRGGHLAYCLYTSGSTGRPKAVALEHRNVMALMSWAGSAFGATETRRVLAATSACFDLSVFEIFFPLTVGGTVLLADDVLELTNEGPNDGAAKSPTLVNTVPSAARTILDASAFPDSVQTFNLAGEVLPRATVDRLAMAFPNARINNLYGPTEYTTYATQATVGGGASITIGRPIANTRVYVLDPELHLTPVGVPGEIYIGGAGLARGYRNRPRLTAERFIPDPFQANGERMYKTGDYGRIGVDGTIEFLGRVDHQVKLRGFRIELGEVERALTDWAGVDQAVAMISADPGSPDARLHAYIVTDEGFDLASMTAAMTAAMTDRLRATLPGFMVPQSIVRLDEIPMTPNGKVDRQALAALDAVRAQSSVEYVAPRTMTEAIVAGIWADVLGLDRVGVHDDFFDMGGHSLVAVRVAVHIRRALSSDVHLRDLFLSPTVASLAARLDFRGDLEPIARVREPGSLPASFGQQRLWFLARCEPETAAYNLPAAWRIRGALDRDALRRSLAFIWRRHEVLRVTFRSDGAELIQVVDHERPLPWALVESSADADVDQILERESQLPFDLGSGPLFRATLICRSDEEHVLLICTHHTVFDGWSFEVLARELGSLYNAFAHGAPSPLPELPIQYADYAVWQRRQLSDGVLAPHIRYWKETLEGAPVALDLPTDRPRAKAPSFRGAWVSRRLESGLAARLDQVCQTEQVTLFMAVATAFSLVLRRYTRQDDVCIAYPVANRRRHEIGGLLGLFTNTLVLRSRCDDTATVRELLRATRASVLDADAHQDVPFERVVEALNPPRDPSRQPLAQVAMTFQDMSRTAPDLGALTVESVPPAEQAAKYDMALFVARDEHGLEVTFEYMPDLFDEETIERFAGHLVQMLEAMVQHPDAPTGELAMTTATEREVLLRTFNDTRVPGDEETVVVRIRQQAERRPRAVAFGAGATSMTYGELWRRAGQLARHLHERGVGPDMRVGVHIEPSPEWVVAALAVLIAGGAYLPFETSLPPARLATMVSEARPPVVISTAPSDLPPGDFEVVAPRDVAPVGATFAGRRDPRPDELAYCIFTSGSTGVPKGVDVTHRGLGNLIAWHERTHGITSSARATQLASVSFDAAAWELWPYLAVGAEVVIVPSESRSDLAGVMQLLDERDITHCFMPTPMAEAALSTPWAREFALQVLLTGGDEFRLRPRSGHPFRIVNHYGPTEASVVTTSGAIETYGRATGLPPIGRPIDNVRVYILDPAGDPVPVGVPGELHIAGTGLARGYAYRPGLTADRFRPDPYGPPGTRMYASGDMARFRTDGVIQFLGRRDRQVSVRGIRIETGEVEAAILTLETVRECVVIAFGHAHEDRRLAAYVVTDHEGVEEPPGWRAALADRLPTYMLPAFLIPMSALPRTANGKIDRAALPAARMPAGTAGKPAPPTSEVERTLAKIWRDTLRLESVGLHDDFFVLGGQSLQVISAVAAVRAQLHEDLNLRVLFTHPTIAQLAERIELQRWLAASSPREDADADRETGEI